MVSRSACCRGGLIVCDLAGIFAYDGRPIDLQGLISIREAMHLRGPDGAGLWSDQESGIALTPSSISGFASNRTWDAANGLA